jgi:hypothetical protein
MTDVRDPQEIARLVHDNQLEGFKVIAKDGEAGMVSRAQDHVDDLHMAVHVGSKLLGSDVAVETEVITVIDLDAKEVRIDRIKDWVKSSPKVKH